MTAHELLDSYAEAWRARDAERTAAHFATDGVRRWVFVVPPVIGGPTEYRGPEQIAVPIRGMLTAMPDLQLDILQSVETGDGVIAEWRHRGTHTGDWNKWTAQGESVEFSGVSIYRVDGDKLLEERIYLDPNLLVRNWVPPLGTLMGVGIEMWRTGRRTKRARTTAR